MKSKKKNPKIQHWVTIFVAAFMLVALVLPALASPAAAAPAGYPSICREYEVAGEITLHFGESITLDRIGPSGGTDHHERITMYLAKYELYNAGSPPSDGNHKVLKYYTSYNNGRLSGWGYQTILLEPYMFVPGVCVTGTYEWNWNSRSWKPVLKMFWNNAWVQRQ